MFSLLSLAATWWLQAAVLATMGLLSATCLRKPAHQSHVLRIAIIAVLLCPLATLSFSHLGVKLLTVDLHSQFLRPATSAASPYSIGNPSSDPFASNLATNIPSNSLDSQQRIAEEANNSGESSLTTELGPAQKALPVLTDQAATQSASVFSNATQGLFARATWLINAAMTIFLVWVVGASLLLARLFLDLRRGHTLLHQSALADPASHQACRQAAVRLRIRSQPRVVVNPFLSSPCLLGHWRPAVLLPEEIEPASYEQVFLHELAHLRRNDWLWTIIGRVAQSILWCQPLVWWLHRQNMSVAEEICDDYVIEQGCNRESYLQQLLQIAELSQPQPYLIGVSMVGFRSKLGRRAVRILDTTRVISTRTGKWFVAFALLIALIATSGVALIEIGQATTASADEPQANNTTDDDGETEGGDSTAESERPDNAPRTYAGIVTGPDGKPLEGALISAINLTFKRDENRYLTKTLATTKSAADGSYSIHFQFEEGGNRILAELPGFGTDVTKFLRLQELFQQNKAELNLHLTKEKRIAGRVVDMEGNPIQGVKVKLVEIVLPTSREAVDKWVVNARPDLLKGRNDFIMMSHDPRITETQFPGRETIDEPLDGGAEIETNADGEFQWEGIGEDCLVQFKLSGPTIATRDALIVTREMPSILAFNHRIRDNDYTHYGASPTIIADPTQPITGVVVDADSELPLAGLNVVVARIGKSNWRVPRVMATTDDEGRFQLNGLPLGGGHIIGVQTPLDQPYFDTSLELPLSSNAAPLQCKLELHQTKWISGRITNDAGEPLVAALNYMPFRDNQHAEKFSNYDPKIMGRAPDEKVVSNTNGEFRIRAIAGPGILAAFVTDHEERPKYIPNRSGGMLERIGGQQMGAVFDAFSADFFDAMVEVNIDPDVNEIAQDLVFKRGNNRTLVIHDESNATVELISVLGTTFPPTFARDQSLSDSSIEIIGLQPSESRLVVLLSSDGRSGKMLTVSGADSAAVKVQLEACATVSGRVLDQDSEPVGNMEVHITPVQEPTQDNWSRELGPVVTDAKGEFELHLASGGLYRLWAYTAMGPNFKASIRPAAGVAYQLGDLRSDMDLKEQATEKLKQETAGIEP